MASLTFIFLLWMQVFVMADLKFPQRMFTLGFEPQPTKSIHYFSGRRDLMESLKKSLDEEEWQELRDSALGVFVNFYELEFTWCSRMVHYMLSMQLDCKQKNEIWCLVGLQPVRFSLHEFEQITGLNCDYVENLEYPTVEYTDEMTRMWELLGVGFDVGPSYTQLQDACSRCHGWERQERIWLGYLAIYTSFIQAQHWTVASSADLSKLLLVPGALETYPWGRLAFKFLINSVKKEANPKLQDEKNYQISGFAEVLNIWIYWACPGIASQYGQVISNNPTPPLLAYKGSRNRKKVDDALRQQTRVINFVPKEFDDMFPKWDDDRDLDAKVENIVKAMMGHFERPWRWTFLHWKNEGKVRICKKELALVKPEVVQSVVVQPEGKVKGVKRKQKEARKDVDEEVQSQEESSVKKRAKSGGNDGEFAEVLKELQRNISEGFNTVITYVNDGFVDLGTKILELTNEVKKLKEQSDSRNMKSAGVNVDGRASSKDGDGEDGGDGDNVVVDDLAAAHASEDEIRKESEEPNSLAVTNVTTAADVLVSFQNPLPTKTVEVKEKALR